MAVELEASDKNANLIGPRGERFIQKDGIVIVPDSYSQYADRCVAPGTIFKKRSKVFSGFDADELAAQHANWQQEHGK